MDSVTWSIKPHTQAKHEILRGYLGAWFPIVSRYNKRIIYLDAFAGPGVYTGGEPGSPLIALETLIEHDIRLKRSETEFLFVFIEKNNSRYQRLENEIESFWLKRGVDQPSNIKIAVMNDEFMNVTQDVLDKLATEGATLAPTFAFVDPFGWSDIRLDLMTQFVSFEKCEILVTFMVEDISRFLDQPEIQKSLQDYFGTDKYKDSIPLSGDERKESLKDLLVNQLKKKGSFQYVIPFEMVSDRGKTKYFLIHCTRHKKGLQVMKDVMWKLDPTGIFRFKPEWMETQALFDGSSDFVQDLKKDIFENFKGQEVFFSNIEDIFTDTSYTIKHIRSALREMEDEGIISVTNRKKRKTYPPGTKITFSEECATINKVGSHSK